MTDMHTTTTATLSATTHGALRMEPYRRLTPEAHAELLSRVGLMTGTKYGAEAIALLEEGRVTCVSAAENHWEVVRRSNNRIYTIQRSTCRCQTTRDPQDSFGCAHLCAVKLYQLVEEQMQKTQTPMFVGDGTPASPVPTTVDDTAVQQREDGQQTAQDAPHATIRSQDDAADVPGETALLEAPIPVHAAVHDQRHRIRRLLVEFGCIPVEPDKKVPREIYAEACETHVGLSLVPEQFDAIIARLEEMVEARRMALPSPKLLKDYTIEVKGKRHVQYPGLLAYAHEQGLVSLAATLTSVSKDLAIATATALFKDGRSFTETADATPENVTPQIKPHFIRMALTRAKARALRDGLNIAEAAAEELE